MQEQASPLELVVNALADRGCAPRSNGRTSWAARCPAHDDRKPSLTVSAGREHPVVLNCLAGCQPERILETLNLTWRDLFDARSQRPDRVELARYDYVDAAGQLALQVVRYEPKAFRQRRPDNRGGWTWNTQGVPRLIYRLPEIQTAIAQGHTIWFAEGEKDADALWRAGAPATCVPRGAAPANFTLDHARWLAGGRVTIVADRDHAGYTFAAHVAGLLQLQGATTVVVEAAEGKDAHDHLVRHGHPLDQFHRIDPDQRLAELDQAAAGPLPPLSDIATTPTARPDSIDLDELLASTDAPYEWLVPGLLERGDRVILTGLEGKGKSTLLRQIGVQLASGIHPFTLDEIPALRVLIVDLENTTRQIRRKIGDLRATAGDRYGDRRLRFEIRSGGIDLTRLDDRDWLTERVATNQPDVLIIGPIYKMAAGDPKDEQVARQVATYLERLNTEYGCALLVEAHIPYADGAKSKRPTRPYGASLWSRWPEFGVYLDPEGGLEHWRGARDERAWPQRLTRATPWPWAVAVAGPDPEAPEGWNGPRNCMAAIVELFDGAGPTVNYSGNQLLSSLRAIGQPFKDKTIREAADRAAIEGLITVRHGPRGARVYSANWPPAQEE